MFSYLLINCFIIAPFVSFLDFITIRLLKIKNQKFWWNIFLSNIICIFVFGIATLIFANLFFLYPIYRNYLILPILFFLLMIFLKYWILRKLIKNSILPLFKISILISCVSFLPSTIFLWSFI